MMTRKITTIVLIAGILLGAAATEGFNVYRESHDGRIFQERARCKVIADAYVKDNTDLNDKSVTGRSVTLERVDYSPARNSCVAEFNTTIFAPGAAYESYSVRDLLSGENIVSNRCTKDCEFLRLNLVNTEFDYIVSNASISVDVLRKWGDTESIYKETFGSIPDAPTSQHKKDFLDDAKPLSAPPSGPGAPGPDSGTWDSN